MLQIKFYKYKIVQNASCNHNLLNIILLNQQLVDAESLNSAGILNIHSNTRTLTWDEMKGTKQTPHI